MDNARWETLGLFFSAVSRATVDVNLFNGLFDDEQQRISVQKFAMRCSDNCIDISTSLDCLNDLQLVLQYETCTVHSLVDGDQSKFLLRKKKIKKDLERNREEEKEKKDKQITYLFSSQIMTKKIVCYFSSSH